MKHLRPKSLLLAALASITVLAEAQTPPAAPAAGPAAGPAERPVPAGPLAPGTGPAAPGTEGGPKLPGDGYKPLPRNTKITFNLEDADLPDLVRLISGITGRRFILPNKNRSIKATVYAPTKVTAAEAYRAFLSILELNGMTVVPSGKYLKIVETTGIENQPLPTYVEGAATPTEDRFLTRLHRLNNVSAEELVQLMTKFKSRDGNVSAYAPTNTLIMTDTGANIQRMMRIIQGIDVARTGEQVWVEPIRYANAADMAKMLQEMFPTGRPAGVREAETPRPSLRSPPSAASSPTGTGAGAASSTDGPSTIGKSSNESRVTKIFADERSNSLIILATERAYMRILEIVRELDRAQEGEGRVHVHYLQHADAEETSGTLTTLISGAAAPGGGAPGGGGGPQAAQGAVFEGQIKITPYKSTNSLIITASNHDYMALKKVIDRIDQPRRQVFIEAVIMELGVDRSSALGISYHGGVANAPTDGSLSVLGFQAAKTATPSLSPDLLTGLALGMRGPNIPESQQLIGTTIPGFGLAITAIANSGESNVLSTPHIIAMDNQEAEINVGENVPLQTSGTGLAGFGLGGAAGAAAGANPITQGLAGVGGLGVAPRQDVGTSLKITPHINDSDQIRLDIIEEISEAKQSTEGTLGVRTITKRNAKTKLVVRDQQTVVIGGLMRDRVITEQTKVPILGDLPLLGMLFKQNRKSVTKTNLLLFLTPYIVRSQSDLRSIYERKMRERQEFLDRYFVFSDTQEYQPPVDYSRSRGMLAEIVTEMEALDSERKLLEKIEGQPGNLHQPKPPIGYEPSANLDAVEDAALSEEPPAGVEGQGPSSAADMELGAAGVEQPALPAVTASPASTTSPTSPASATSTPREPPNQVPNQVPSQAPSQAPPSPAPTRPIR